MQIRPMYDSDDEEFEPNLSDDEPFTEMNRNSENGSPGNYSYYNTTHTNYNESPTYYAELNPADYGKFSKMDNHHNNQHHHHNQQHLTRLNKMGGSNLDVDDQLLLDQPITLYRPQTHPIHNQTSL